MSYRGIAQRLNVSLGTVHVWDTFVATGDVSAKKAPARVSLRILDDYHELLVVGLLLNQPDIKEICQHIFNNTGVTVSEPTICRILRKHGLTRKKIRQVAVQRCSVMRGQFMAEMSLFHVNSWYG